MGVIYIKTVDAAIMVGTGFLIAGDLVLTVAHNIYSRKRGECFKDLVFYPGVSGELTNVLPIKVVDYRYPKQFESCLSQETIDHDYALLKLERRVERPSYIQLGLSYAKQEEKVLLSGYPGHSCNEDLAPQSFLWKGGHQIEGTALKHWLSTFKGNSGSPLFARRVDSLVAFAIHKGAPSHEQHNCARLITKEVLTDILVWEKEMASEVRFCVMGPNITTTVQARPDEWLKQQLLQIKVALSQLEKQSPSKVPSIPPPPTQPQTSLPA